MLRTVRISGLSFLVALSGAVTPGPLLALVIAQVMARGFPAVLPIMAGHALLEVVFVAALAAGMAKAWSRPRVRGVFSIIGGLVMAWMAWAMVRDATSMTFATNGAKGLSWPMLVAAGAGVSLANPYFTGWWATVGTGQFAALRLRRRRDLLAFFCGHQLGDIAWYVFVAAILTGGRNWLTNDLYQWLIMACGMVMGFLAVLFVAVGIHACCRSADAGPSVNEPVLPDSSGSGSAKRAID